MSEEVEKNNKMLLAIKADVWRKIPHELLNVLCTIARCYGKNGVYDAVFEYDVRSPKSTPTWEKLNRLDSLNLIWIKRDGQKITEIFCHEDLYPILKNEYPDKFLDFATSLKSKLDFDMRSAIVDVDGMPGYKFTFLLTESVVVPSNMEIEFKFVDNGDGTVRFCLSPVWATKHFPEPSAGFPMNDEF